MAETITLDPSAVATNRTELDINSGPIVVRQDGVDWGNAEIEAVMADMDRGSSPVDYRIPNRQITIPLKIQASGTVSFNQARAKLQKKVALIQQEGGWLKRIVGNSGGTIYADIVNAGLTMSGGWMQDHNSIDADAELRLEALPDFYEDEITLSDHTETTLPDITFTETSLRGDYPARVRLVVDDDSANNQNSLIWSIRSRNYNAGTTAAMAYQAEALTTLDAATRTALSGASGGTVVQHASLADDWTPVVGTDMNSGVKLTHTGTHRCFARVYSNGGTSTSGGTISTRLVWDVGDLVTPTENPAWNVPTTGSQFYIADLGEVRLDRIPTGTHRWGGQIQAKGQGGTIAVDRVWFLNTDDGFGICRGAASATTLSSFSARDAFDQTAGTLTGKTLATGGTWTGAGDADDFSVETTGHTAQRTAVSDSSGHANARWAIAGTATYTTQTVQCDLKWSAAIGTGSFGLGVVARYTDTSNFLIAYINPTSASSSSLFVTLYVAGSPVPVLSSSSGISLGSYYAIPSTFYRVKLSVTSGGVINVWGGFASLDLPVTPLFTGQNNALATGGALASGKAGIFDWNSTATASTRNYDNFLVTVPTPDSAIFASQSAELSQRAILREDSTGTAYGPIADVTGDLPRLPPAGMDGRTTEVIVKASRGDLDTSPDSAIDDISARAYYRPSWLYVPD
jgi:hypothetical protein